ncbi:hypothetical protein BGZ47_005375 [Haplosporangium gracile]|nr:hypothetical protein BGZ47_005375 [Haplosporangium gracile]
MFPRGASVFSRARGQVSRGQERGRGRGFSHGDRGREGFDVSRGGYFGRGRGRGVWAGFSDQEQTDIMTSRLSTTHISSEGTDDLIVPSPSGGEIDLAMQVLQSDSLDALQSPVQIRKFLQSCLLNLSNHHSVDTSAVFYNLASEKGLAKLYHIMLYPEPVEDGGDITSSIVTFQTITLPLIGVLTRQSLCQSILTHQSNRVYGLVQELCHPFLGLRVLPIMHSLSKQDLTDVPSSASLLHPQYEPHEHQQQQQHQQHQDSHNSIAMPHCALIAILRLIYQLVMRFPNSISGTATLIRDLSILVDRCRLQSETGSAKQVLFNSTLTTEMARLSTIVQNNIRVSRGCEEQSLQTTSSSIPSQSTSSPDDFAPHDPRRDNNHAMIDKINIFPTRGEVLCSTEPFLPINDHKEPSMHFLPRGWSRHLDIHFRLCRQDFMYPLCTGIQAFFDLLGTTDKCSGQDFVDPKEPRSHIKDNVRLDVYGNVKFLDVSVLGNQAGQTTVIFDQPIKVRDLDCKERREFWELSQNRLMYGDIVCFVRRSHVQFRDHQVVVALIQKRDIDELCKSELTAHIHVSLLDPASYPVVFAPLQSPSSNSEQWFMVECSGVFFESVRPVLKALQGSQTWALPFGKYIAPTDEEIAHAAQSLNVGAIDPPVYTNMPEFEFDLSVLLLDENVCGLNVRDPESVNRAVTVLRERGSLDNTQALTLVETLGREIALISGPPGSGKTKIGVDLMRVLLHNKKAMNCGPILVVCYTNHALDQFLERLLDEGITSIIRIGSQSKSHRLQEYNLKPILIKRKKPYAVKRELVDVFTASEKAAQAIRDLTLVLKSGYFDWKHVREHLNPAQRHQFEASPPLPVARRDKMTSHRGQMTGKVAYERWATGKDLDEKRAGNHNFATLNEDALETVGAPHYDTPVSDRAISLLGGDVWSMSMEERCCLIEHWRPDIIRSIEEELGRHQQCLKSAEERKYRVYDELRRLIISGMDIIGMTTTSSAKFHDLLASVAPKVILCEEAGEVLESHILTALSPSTQHLILIGDHLQFRPTVWTYNLSSESSVGKKYNLDKSLFERLLTSDTNPLPVSRLATQRRMRPEISNLIRNTYYPDLEDGGPVFQYPDVGGMDSNLFFMDHGHSEDKKYSFGLQSFSNTFEVEMIEALAVHLIKNGYDQPGDIVILTPYVGQLAKIRNHLKDRFVILVHDRDAEWLDAGGVEGFYEKLKGTQSHKKSHTTEDVWKHHITVRTIDNFQGEEAKIVLISLVRSETDFDDDDLFGSIGFLKSPGRANMLLSRAQHGMFLIGNAGTMARSEHGIWPAMLTELQQSGRVGQGFPIVCKNHPETRRVVCSAEDLQAAAPDGGCSLPCGFTLSCGHLCPRFFAPLPLACGHVLEITRCWQLWDPTNIACTAEVDKKLGSYELYCGHQCPSICGEPCPSVKFCPECSETATETLVSDKGRDIRLAEVDIDRDPLMVPPCGHALTVSTLDEMMDLGRYYQEQKDESSGSVLYVGLRELHGSPSDEVVCVECSQPIGASFFRYGRLIKHSQLLHLMQRFRKTQMSGNKQRCEDASRSLSQAKDALLQNMTKTTAPPCPVSTRSIDRRVTVQDGVLVGDLGEIASLYHISWRHQSVWKKAIEPAAIALAFFGQSLVEQSSIKDLTTLLVQKSLPLGQGSQWPRRRSAPTLASQNPPFSPTDEELSQVIRTLGLEDAVRTDEDVKLCNIGSSCLILSSILDLAVEAMQAAGGVDSGWYWFVGDLIDCYQLYNSQHKKMALDCGQASTASIAGEMVLEGYYQKVRWMFEKPLGGMGSSKKFEQALQNLEQAFRAEVSEQRDDDLGPEHEQILVRLGEGMMALLQKQKQQHEE